mgnify:FL=1
MVAAFRAAGFAAVVLDRRGYKDSGRRVGSELRRLLGSPIVASGDRRWELFSLATDRSAAEMAKYPDPEIFYDSFESGESDRWSEVGR